MSVRQSMSSRCSGWPLGLSTRGPFLRAFVLVRSAIWLKRKVWQERVGVRFCKVNSVKFLVLFILCNYDTINVHSEEDTKCIHMKFV